MTRPPPSRPARPARRSLQVSVFVVTALAAIAGLSVAALPPRGQVPGEVRQRVVADLSARTGRDVAAVSGYYALTELRAQAVTWPDDRLGCQYQPAPARSEPVAGYWLVFQIGSNTYDYRVAGDRLVICDPPPLRNGDEDR